MNIINLNISFYYTEKLSQIFLSLIFTPVFFKLLGGDNYALIGLYVVFQNIVNKLDFGIVATFSREISFNLKNKTYIEKLTNQFEYIYLFIFIIIFFIFYFLDAHIFFDWSENSDLKINEFQYSIKIIGVIVALSFCSILYSSGLAGLERHLVINSIKTTFHALKFIGGSVFLFFFSNNILDFFLYLFVITLIEFLFFLICFYYYSKQAFFNKFRKIDLGILKKIAPFSLHVAYNTILFIILLDFFQLFLSIKLTSIEFGYFSLMLIICRAVNETTMPITRVLRPRLINLISENKITKFTKLLFDYSITSAYLSFAIAIVIYTHREFLIFGWLNDHNALNWMNDIIIFFLLGSAFQATGYFSSIVCQALDKMNLYSVILTVITTLALILMFLFIDKYGIMGAGLVWLFISLLLFLGAGLIYRICLPKFFFKWILSLALIIIIIGINCILLNKFVPLFSSGNSLIVILESILRGIFILIISSPAFFISKKIYKF